MRNDTAIPSIPAADQHLLATMERIERRLDRLEASLSRVDALAQGAPPVFAVLTDTADSIAARAGDAGVDVEARLRSALQILDRLTRPAVVPVLDRALSLVEQVALAAVVGKAALALADTCGAEPRRVGPWDTLRALGEPDVQRAAGFMIGLARRFGQALSPVDPSHRLPGARGA